jgi:hypothetical protein
MLGHASAAMTLDVYADLFESDWTVLPTACGTCGPGRRHSRSHQISVTRAHRVLTAGAGATGNRPPPAQTLVSGRSLLSGLN